MSTLNQNWRWVYQPNGISTSFAFDNLVIAAADLVVSGWQSNGAPLALPTFTVTGLGNPSGGNVVFDSPPAAVAGSTIEIVRRTAKLQGKNFKDFVQETASVREQMADRAMLGLQEAEGQSLRTIHLSAVDANGPMVLPPLESLAGKYLGFDAASKPVGVDSPVGSVGVLTVETFSVLRLSKTTSTVVTVLGGDAPNDGAGGTFDRLIGVTASDDDVLTIVDALGRAWRRRYSGRASARWYRAKGDGLADDTLPLLKFFGPTGPQAGWLPSGIYRVSRYIRATGFRRDIAGPPDAIIKLDASLTVDGGGIYRIQPALLVDIGAAESAFRGFSVNHSAADFPVWPAADFRADIFSAFSGDARGCAVLVMADKVWLDGINVFNGWDNGIGIGRFDEVTGIQSAAPDQPRASNCRTYQCGVGKHAWPTAPNGYYFQGAGINVMTAINFAVENCTDYGSYNGFWCDIHGGGRGVFTNCNAEFTQVGPIFSDAATGGNQPWNTGGFGGSISGAGSGWLKSPGGLAFYSGSYGVQFINCVAESPGLYGFVTDYFSSKNVLVGCRVYNAGLQSFVISGSGHKLISPVSEGSGQSAGVVAPSGSVCPTMAAIMVTGMQEISSGLNIDGECEIVSPVVSKGRTYPNVALPSAKYDYAIKARTRNGRTARVTVVGGSNIEAGTSGQFDADANSRLNALTAGASGASGQFTVMSVGGSVALNLLQGTDSATALQLLKDTSGNVVMHHYHTDGTITLTQQRTGGNNKGIHIWAGSVRLLNLPTSSAGLFQGDLWMDSGAGNVIKRVP